MFFRTTKFFAGLTIALFLGATLPAAAGAAERPQTNCHVQSARSPGSDEPWAFRTTRTADRECGLRRAAGRATRSAAPNPSDPWTEFLKGEARPAIANCVATPNRHAPRDMQWRYRVDPATAQKCWLLVRAIPKPAAAAGTDLAAAAEPSKFEGRDLGSLRSVAETQAGPQHPDKTLALSLASEAHNATGGAGIADQPSAPTFESRWVVSTDMRSATNARAISAWNDEGRVGDIARVRAEPFKAANYEGAPHLVLATALAILSVALGLYAATGGLSYPLRWGRPLDSGFYRFIRSADRAEEVRRSPPVAPTIADVLAQLNREDLDQSAPEFPRDAGHAYSGQDARSA